jgi:hypothetical protein
MHTFRLDATGPVSAIRKLSGQDARRRHSGAGADDFPAIRNVPRFDILGQGRGEEPVASVATA